jgi:hypothetical protein
MIGDRVPYWLIETSQLYFGGWGIIVHLRHVTTSLSGGVVRIQPIVKQPLGHVCSGSKSFGGAVKRRQQLHSKAASSDLRRAVCCQQHPMDT